MVPLRNEHADRGSSECCRGLFRKLSGHGGVVWLVSSPGEVRLVWEEEVSGRVEMSLLEFRM